MCRIDDPFLTPLVGAVVDRCGLDLDAAQLPEVGNDTNGESEDCKGA